MLGAITPPIRQPILRLALRSPQTIKTQPALTGSAVGRYGGALFVLTEVCEQVRSLITGQALRDVPGCKGARGVGDSANATSIKQAKVALQGLEHDRKTVFVLDQAVELRAVLQCDIDVALICSAEY